MLSQLLCYTDYLCIISVLRLKTHSVAFKAATASHEPTHIGGFEIEKAKTIAAGGKRGAEGGVGGPARREKAARGSNGNVTRLKFLKLGLQMQPNIGARPP